MAEISALEVAAGLAFVPDGSMVTDALVVVSFLDADGTSSMRFVALGDAPLSDRLGCLTWAEHLLVRNRYDRGTAE